jgi:hypothetical protein
LFRCTILRLYFKSHINSFVFFNYWVFDRKIDLLQRFWSLLLLLLWYLFLELMTLRRLWGLLLGILLLWIRNLLKLINLRLRMRLIRSILDVLFFIILLSSIINSFNFSYLLLLMLLLLLLILLNLWRLNLIALLKWMSLLSQNLLLFNSWYEIPWMIIILLKWILVILLLSITIIWWIKRSEA